MFFRRLGQTIVALGLAITTGCAFDPRGVEPTDAAAIDALDAATIDALDATPIDALDAPPPIDAIDAPLPLDACVPSPGGERCNGVDDDCDLLIDETFPTLGTACDGPDSDLCLDDAVACDPSGVTTVCANPTPDDDVERCNGSDDDCDLMIDETFPTLGDLCDGPDGDLCREGSLVCTTDATGVTCTDVTPTNTETCNSVDDDCDLAVDETFPTLGTACDGVDGDSCTEGTLECDPSGTTTRCNDLTGTIVEGCNTTDDDCDLAVDETFDLTSDLANCGQCGRACTNGAGTTSCVASACAPVCTTAGALNCDGNVNNGCEPRNTNPACTAGTSLGTVRGDVGTDVLTATGYAEAVYRVTVNEANGTSFSDLDAQITLTSPTTIDFDLTVTCRTCGAASVSSNATGVDTVNIGRNDVGGDSGYELIIEVRWFSSSACGNWSLTVTGNVDTNNNSCN